jgi:hypothetical protein
VQDVHVTDSSVARGGSPVKQPEALEAIERSKIRFCLILFVLRLGFQPDRHALNG